jgi:hypothetical protein
MEKCPQTWEIQIFSLEIQKFVLSIILKYAIELYLLIINRIT